MYVLFVKVIVAGLVSTLYGKRPDLKVLGFLATSSEIISIIACSAATILTTTDMAKQAGRLPGE